MSEKTREIICLIDMLPEHDQNLAFEIIKRMVLAWDPDFTKLTDSEKYNMNIAETEIDNGNYVTHDQIEW